MNRTNEANIIVEIAKSVRLVGITLQKYDNIQVESQTPNIHSIIDNGQSSRKKKIYSPSRHQPGS